MSVYRHLRAKMKNTLFLLREQVFNLQNEFKQFVIDDFINEYIAGRTPNPCLVCNRKIKFGEMLKIAELDVSELYNTYGEQKINDAILYAKDLKDRYTVLWLNYETQEK